MLKRHHHAMGATTLLSREALRRLDQEFEADLSGLIDWSMFTLALFQAALAAKLTGVIKCQPFHWENAACFGLTLAVATPQGPWWLVLYEAEADAEHQLAIILHEFVHILRGHARADMRLLPADVRDLIAALLPPSVDREPMIYTRWCAQGAGRTRQEAIEELEAEVGAMWILRRARRAGALARIGQSFAAEHHAIDVHLRGVEEHG